jgi:hypothetical protein
MTKQLQERDSEILFFIGHNRTGKTSIAKQIAIRYKNADKKRKIITFDPQNRFRDIANGVIYEVKDMEKYLKTTDTMFIFDDYRGLYTSDKADALLLRAIFDRAEYCNDFIFIAHAPNFILERLSFFVTKYYIFYTQSTDKGFKGKINNGEQILSLSKKVNQYVLTKCKNTPKGKGIYPNFPFIIYDQMNEKAKKVNFIY